MNNSVTQEKINAYLLLLTYFQMAVFKNTA